MAWLLKRCDGGKAWKVYNDQKGVKGAKSFVSESAARKYLAEKSGGVLVRRKIMRL